MLYKKDGKKTHREEVDEGSACQYNSKKSLVKNDWN